MDTRILFFLAVISFVSCMKTNKKPGLPSILDNSSDENHHTLHQAHKKKLLQDQSDPPLSSHILESYMTVPESETPSPVQGCNKLKDRKGLTAPTVNSDLGEPFIDVQAEEPDLGEPFEYVPGEENSSEQAASPEQKTAKNESK